MWRGGIDWSEKSLDYCIRSPDGRTVAAGQVKPTVEGLAELFARLDQIAPPGQIGLAVETSHGAWLQAILDRGYLVYPVNPKVVERFREALTANGEKSDTIDGDVLSLYLGTFHQKLRPLRPDAPEIVALRIACQDRLRLVQERTAKLLELEATLKTYYPAFLGLFENLDSEIALIFLEQFPTQAQFRALTPRRLQSFLSRHGYPCRRRLPEMLQHLARPALPAPRHLQQAKAPLVRYLAGSLRALKAEIDQQDDRIQEQFEALPESRWAASLPRVGKVLAPCLVAVFGRDTSRFPTPADAQAFFGTAPVTKASGNSHVVKFRRGCWKFARRTLHLAADQLRLAPTCGWARALYERQRASGHRHARAVRAIAHKLVKIILAMQRTGQPYREEVFANSQRLHLPRPNHMQTTRATPTLT